jgi:hypothetical protein
LKSCAAQDAGLAIGGDFPWLGQIDFFGRALYCSVMSRARNATFQQRRRILAAVAIRRAQ